MQLVSVYLNNMSYKKKLEKLEYFELQCKLKKNGVKNTSGSKDVLIHRILEHDSFSFKLWRWVKNTIFLIGKLFIPFIIGLVFNEIFELPIVKREHVRFKTEVFEWDQKDKRIEAVYRISKSHLDLIFPFGYQIFATNPDLVLPSTDTIFSSLLTAEFHAVFRFDHSKKSIDYEIADYFFEGFNNSSTTTYHGNRYRGSMDLPPVGLFGPLEGIYYSKDLVLTFLMLDDTPNDEIYALGLREDGNIKEHVKFVKDYKLKNTFIAK